MLDPPSIKFFFFCLYIYSSSKQAEDGTERESIHERESNFKEGQCSGMIGETYPRAPNVTFCGVIVITTVHYPIILLH